MPEVTVPTDEFPVTVKLLKVEVPLLVTLIELAWIGPAKVEVEVLVTTRLLTVVVPEERVLYKVVAPVTWRVEEAKTPPEEFM